MMRTQVKQALQALPLAALLTTALASADVVELKNGDRFTGTIAKISDGAMTLTSDYGEMSIPVDQIAGIDTAEPMRVTTPNGDEVLGTLTNDGAQQYLRTDTGLRPLAIADLNQVVDLDICRQTGADVVSDALYQHQVLLHELVGIALGIFGVGSGFAHVTWSDLFSPTRRSTKNARLPLAFSGGGQRFECRRVAAAGKNYVRFGSLIAAGPVPDTDAGRAVSDGLVDRQPLR